MQVRVTCNYCDKKWDQYVYSSAKTGFKCPRCNESKSFTVEKGASESIDYYIGSPPFPSETKVLDDSYDGYMLTSNDEDTELTSD